MFGVNPMTYEIQRQAIRDLQRERDEAKINWADEMALRFGAVRDRNELRAAVAKFADYVEVDEEKDTIVINFDRPGFLDAWRSLNKIGD